MKKIYAVLFLNNEADIIEAYCRYTLSYCDGILLYGRNSVDGSIDIVTKMINEGLDIIIMNSLVDPSFIGLQVLEAMMQYAFSEKNADLVLPMDPDEFLMDTEKGNPREALELFDDRVEYQVIWRTHIYKPTEKGDRPFPSGFTHFRDPKLEKFCKTIISRRLFWEIKVRLAPGKHSVTYPENIEPQIVRPTNLVLAHYPVRGPVQMIKKIIPGQLKIMTGPPYMGFHWEKIYDYIRIHHTIENEQLTRMSLEYALWPQEIPAGIIRLGEVPYLNENLRAKTKTKYSNSTSKDDLFTVFWDVAEQIIKDYQLKEQRLEAHIQQITSDIQHDNCQLFFDIGYGFNEENSCKKICCVGHNKIKFLLDSDQYISGYRFDPCELPCMVYIRDTFLCKGRHKIAIDIIQTNGQEVQPCLYFAANDPQIFFSTNESTCDALEIEYDIIFL